ncbi:hypothetical protein LOTGIDRAFT_182052 [Lottia gigantea]|uniref:cysteine--tRNA ligase n=1 Tax=Lottia gigantea TaxID=225164 RepID=V4AES1_LOTGI|nr:hypothetical protein LOTGIDRAFT_182052 [Lottia gigantea]ESO93660.1 hypothetical protein LOTGIDRAFT_182052 [Lottia gigantea]
MGLTDIDDKIINKANKDEKPFTEIAKKYEVEFLQDMNKLNILSPSYITRVSDHIPQIIQYIQTIQQKDLTYPTDDGSVYFDVIKYGRYGYFRPYVKDEDYKGFKKHSSDFALWKGAKLDEPFWESPWGKGRPGWHIECSAMASGIFGSNFDVHSGGVDLKFPHHENEIAQSQAHYNCHQWVNYWIHTGYLHLKGDENKMSKSLKNVVGISDLLENYTADQFRMMCLLTAYRHYLEYSEDVMTKTSTNLNQILNCLNLCDIYVKGQLHCKSIDEVQLQKRINDCRVSFKKHLANDFDTTKAFDDMFELVKFLNSSLSKIEQEDDHIRCPATVAAASLFIKSTLTKLGFDLANQMSSSKGGDMLLLNKAMDNLVDLRLTVRKFCLDPPAQIFTEPLENKKLEKKRRKEVFSPLLKKCDTAREDLKSVNISIKDLGNDSSWLIEKK